MQLSGQKQLAAYIIAILEDKNKRREMWKNGYEKMLQEMYLESPVKRIMLYK